MKKISIIFNKYSLFFLLLLLLISYGQIFFMQPWQDDNALFFKLAHINGSIGFLGQGILGEGPYRLTATPYYLVYLLFGYNTKFYFIFAFIFYLLASVCLYYSFKNLINKTTAWLITFLFVTNYVTSDSFIRLFNSVSTSLGIIFFSGFLVFYTNFFKHKKIIWYILAILFFTIFIEVSFVRAHFVFLVVLIMDIILMMQDKKFNWGIKYFLNGLLRLIPFLIIFYLFYIRNGDSRSIHVLGNISLVFSGKFENLLSLFSAVGYLVLPDKLSSYFVINIPFSTNPYYKVLMANMLVALIFSVACYFLSGSKKLTTLFMTFSLIWIYLSRLFYQKITTVQPFSLLFVEFLGGLSLLALVIAGFKLKKISRGIFFIFFGLILINIYLYILYDPTVFFNTYNSRYLVFSYFGLIACIAILGTHFQSKKFVLIPLILFWGLVNLVINISNQHEILVNRSFITQSFYKVLQKSQPTFPKGAVLYFDIQDSSLAKTRYSDAVTSSQAPDTTALAWRYGIDRYDFQIVNDYKKLIGLLQNGSISQDKIFSFWYSNSGLVDTTTTLREHLSRQTIINNPVAFLPISKTSLEVPSKKKENTLIQPEFELTPTVPITSLTSTQLSLEIVATPFESSKLKYPINMQADNDKSVFGTDVEAKKLALEYMMYKESLSKLVKINVSSFWRDNLESNLIDEDWNSLWQADRVLWSKNGATITLDLGDNESVDRLVWVNGFADQTPIRYDTLVSSDRKSWSLVSKVNTKQRLEGNEPQIITFNPVSARFVQLKIYQTLNNDAPGIAEIWVVPDKFHRLDIKKTEIYLENPFSYIKDEGDYMNMLSGLGNVGEAEIFWQSDKKDGWQTSSTGKFHLLYDNQVHKYQIELPAGGTQITNIKMNNFSIPGQINILNISVVYPKII